MILWTGVAEAERLSSQRTAFLVADKALQNGKRSVFENLQGLLEDYPLYPYLLYRDLVQRFPADPTGEVRAFLDRYADSPLAERLRSAWLRHLFSQGRWTDFLRDYRTSGDVAMACRQRQALLYTGQQKEALDGIEAVWMSGTSRPEVCDPLFALWRQQGGFTRERVWRRFGLAMAAGQIGVARYLRGLLPAADRPQAELWLRVHADPSLILEAALFDPNSPHTPAILLHGLDRWSRSDSVSAAPAFDLLRHRYRLPDAELARLERRIAVFVATRGHPDGLARLAALPEVQVDDEVRAWRVRAGGLQPGDWQATLYWLERMPPEQRDELQWQYWRARALEALGRRDEARPIYQKIVGQRDYYGFLAAERLDVPYRFGHAPVAISAAEAEMLLDRLPGLQRARELYLLTRAWEARSEWNHATQSLDEADLKRAAVLAHGWGWHDRAITMLAQAESWDDLELRFPLPYRDRVTASGLDENVDPAWIYAVMRQESAFRPDARSVADALGLMQILPATGRRIGQALKTGYPGRYGLLRTDTNIRFGAHYLRYTLDRLQGNPLLATAAYNAGPHRVAQWLPENEVREADVWAELIPFGETREYVKRVMEYAAIYDWRLGRKESSMGKRMKPVLPEGP